ncbi:uncharacterized protein LOC119193176 [Manduca sexta]|uniref:uncharacterized protein LOC119193176 n=1 Tax=Manduca sexta TaxID=7130 RepID=UPI00188ED310|nr:uncharacterized protein LOC119193176 [Manduca sexta]
MVEDWALEVGLDVLNRGSVATCVRMRACCRLASNGGGGDAVGPPVYPVRRLHRSLERASPTGPKWSTLGVETAGQELLLEASIVQSWVQAPVRPDDVNNEADWFREAMSSVCDSAMPRVRRSQARVQGVLVVAELASLQAACYAARRRYTRYRQIRIRPVDAVAREAELYQGYRDAKDALSGAILESKNRAHQELLESLDADPWGRPKMMRSKLRIWAPPLTQSLRQELVEGVVGALFLH